MVRGNCTNSYTGFLLHAADPVSQGSAPSDIQPVPNLREAASLAPNAKVTCDTDEENSHPRTPRQPTVVSVTESPLSLMPADLNLVENSRNRKPIYITQSIESNQS